MNKLMFAAFAAVTASGAWADTFPSADATPDEQGRYDLASAQNWGGSVPGPSTEVKFKGAKSYVVTASDDVEFGLLNNALDTWHQYAITFDMTGYEPARKLKFTGFYTGGGSSTMVHNTIKGGEWNFGGGTFGSPNGSHYGDIHNLVISDGSVITNVGGFYLGYTDQYALHADICGQSKFFANGEFRFTLSKALNSSDPNYLKVYDGSRLDVGKLTWEQDGGAWKDGLAIGTFKDYILVSNATMNVTGSDYAYFGRRGLSKVHVTRNGAMTVNGAVIANEKYAQGNLVRVEDGGTLTLKSAWYGGWLADGHPGLNRNRVEVLDGGTMTVALSFNLGHNNNSGNTLVVSNGAMTVGSFSWGSSGCSNGTVRIQGARASYVDRTTEGLFSAVPNCTFEVLDGAAFTLAQDYLYNMNSAFGTNCTLRIANGGKVTRNGNVFTVPVDCVGDQKFASCDTRLIVEDAGVFECALLALQGLNASLRVDDGTARLTTLVAGYTYEYGGKGQDAVVTIAGANPSLKASNSLEFYAGSKLVFELPEAGYEEGCIPVDVGKVGGWGSGCKLEFVGAAAMQARHLQDEIDARYVLVRAPSGAAFIPDAAIAEAQAALGDGFRLYKTVSDGYQMLMLRVRLNKGLTIILN